jgi:hypothetical protein
MPPTSPHVAPINGQDAAHLQLGCLPDVDQRTATAKRYRALAADLLSDLGGSSECSTNELELIRRISALGVLCSQVETRIVRGESLSETEHANYIAALNAQGRASARLGLRRRAKPVPSLSDYLSHYDSEKEGAA